jgi:hypothetical protein
LAVKASDVQVEEVAGARAMDEFLRFQLDHYAGDPNFVPPIVAERREFLDPKQNPFFEDAKGVYFLARRGDKVYHSFMLKGLCRYIIHVGKAGCFGSFE